MIGDVVQSTTTVLAATATYTGAAFPVDDATTIVVSVYSNVSGTLYVDQRSDGTNWDTVASFPYTGGALDGHAVEIVGTEARLRYINGAADQGTFRLYARKKNRMRHGGKA